jgi:hypothetical protein
LEAVMLTADRLREILSFDAATGLFRWKTGIPKQMYRIGRVAGAAKPGKYGKVKIDGITYWVHRLAWLHFYGSWPVAEIDHINGRQNDNSILNLRESSRAENAANCKKPSDNTSGFKGVTYRKHRGKYEARLRKNGRHIFLGHFDTGEAAHSAYCAAAHIHFGQFARAE